MAPPEDVDAGSLLDLATQAAERAVAILLDGRRRALETVRSKSTATDMVSEMDHAAEALIHEVLLGARPDDGFLGEETGASSGTSGITWVVDPLDGTTDYLYDHPGWNVSIAATNAGGAVAAVVAIPHLGETFTATRGGGTRRNGEPVRCSVLDELPGALCATGFAYDPERRRRQAEVLTAVLPRIRDVRRMGAAAADLCSVACGRVDAYWERGLGPWDAAAGALIAREAGATVWGDDLAPGTFVLAAGPGIFTALRDLLADSGAAEA
jgi:myo-inositol-1(or 4)-monophosphatase